VPQRGLGREGRGDPVRAGAQGDPPQRVPGEGGIRDHRPGRGRAEGRDRAALVAGDLLCDVLVRHRQPVHAQQGAQLRPGDLAIPRHQHEQEVALPAPHHQRLDDVARGDAAGRGRLLEGAHAAVPGDLVLQSGDRQGIVRALFAHGPTIVSAPRAMAREPGRGVLGAARRPGGSRRLPATAPEAPEPATTPAPGAAPAEAFAPEEYPWVGPAVRPALLLSDGVVDLDPAGGAPAPTDELSEMLVDVSAIEQALAAEGVAPLAQRTLGVAVGSNPTPRTIARTPRRA